MIVEFSNKIEARKQQKIADIELIDRECEYQEKMKLRRICKVYGIPMPEDGIDHTLEDRFHEQYTEDYETACERMLEAVRKYF